MITKLKAKRNLVIRTHYHLKSVSSSRFISRIKKKPSFRWLAGFLVKEGCDGKLNKRGRNKLGAAVGLFIQKYGRKAQGGGSDPNDRQYDRKLRKKIERMDPETLDQLMRGEDSSEEP